MTAHWKRKHLDDLAGAVKRYSSEAAGALLPEHQETLAEIYQRAKRFSTCTQNSTDANVGEVVVALCRVCREIGRHPCQGRDVWSQTCALVVGASR